MPLITDMSILAGLRLIANASGGLAAAALGDAKPSAGVIATVGGCT